VKKSNPVIIAGIFVVVLAAAYFILTNAPGKYDDFARCLSASGAKMYGSYWCPHCNEQKEMFGSSWKYMNYIECSLPARAGQTQACIDANITSYPTWEFNDGNRTLGVLSFDDLSQKTGCKTG
jgi:hypothetical protein